VLDELPSELNVVEPFLYGLLLSTALDELPSELKVVELAKRVVLEIRPTISNSFFMIHFLQIKFLDIPPLPNECLIIVFSL
jgi:hypothetical protein